MIHDFNSGTVAWTDWNILLDENGGPNHVGNFCFAPIHADTKTGNLIFTSSYYYIGHFSKFIKPGAKRIACSSTRSQLLSTAFINPDGKIAIVVMNQQNKAIPFNLCISNKAINIISGAHSIMTIVL
jgi:glucosylceramidase